MGIKTNVVENKLQFPLLMEGVHTSFVVLVTAINDSEEYSGTVVKGSPLHTVGYKSDSWDSTGFKPFNGTLELSNN